MQIEKRLEALRDAYSSASQSKGGAHVEMKQAVTLTRLFYFLRKHTGLSRYQCDLTLAEAIKRGILIPRATKIVKRHGYAVSSDVSFEMAEVS